jgi:hypothetical protein
MHRIRVRYLTRHVVVLIMHNVNFSRTGCRRVSKALCPVYKATFTTEWEYQVKGGAWTWHFFLVE